MRSRVSSIRDPAAVGEDDKEVQSAPDVPEIGAAPRLLLEKVKESTWSSRRRGTRHEVDPAAHEPAAIRVRQAGLQHAVA